MDFLKNFLSEKKYGFYVTVIVSLFAVISGIIFVGLYGGSRDFSVFADVCLFLCLIPLAMSLFKPTAKYAHYVLYVLILFALLGYVKGMYLYVSEVMVGIDEYEYSARFILCTILVIINVVASFVNCFFKQVKDEVKEEVAHE